MSADTKDFRGLVEAAMQHHCPVGGVCRCVPDPNSLPMQLCDALDAAKAEIERQARALNRIKRKIETQRIWGGMDWVYNPLHPKIQTDILALIDALLPKGDE